MPEYTTTDDGSHVATDGRVLYFSLARFRNEICDGDACFICGRKDGCVDFNREHIIPKWILRQFGLFDRNMTMMHDGRSLKYGRLTVQCCSDCNSLMGRMVEQPVREILAGGFPSINEHIRSHGTDLFAVWLALIFVKLHLKSKDQPETLDRRISESTLASTLDWEAIHHVHCIARTFYTRAYLDPGAHGSLMILPARTDTHFEHFDFADLREEQVLLLRLNDVCFISVFCDACAASSRYIDSPYVKAGLREMSPLQLREIMAHLAYLNAQLKVRPKFYSEIGPKKPYAIVAKYPAFVELLDDDNLLLGHYMELCCGDTLRSIDDPNLDSILQDFKEGRVTFLLNDEGEFNTDSMQPLANVDENGA